MSSISSGQEDLKTVNQKFVETDTSLHSNQVQIKGGDTVSQVCDESDIVSPDISLSSQNTLRYSDVEPQLNEHNTSHESSDSIETLEEPESEGPSVSFNQSFLQHLRLNPGVSVSSAESGDRCSMASDTGSGGSHEVIAELSHISRPESLSLSRSTSQKDTNDMDIDSLGRNEEGAVGGHQKSSEITQNRVAKNDILWGEEDALSQSLPQGTITRKGGLIQFVASDLQAKIKQSSPLSQPGSSGSRRSSIHSFASVSSSTSFATSSGLSQSPGSGHQRSPEDIPPIDASAVAELEAYATRVADSLDLMMGNIRNNLHKMSAITIGCQDAYKRSVDITCDSVDGSIKTMYALMAKCEELSASMGPVKQLANQIKEIKRILDLFESQLADK